jgi:hypothetical protein
MNKLLKQICDVCSGGVVDLNIKAHMPEGINFSSIFFACPMIAIDHLDCISGVDSSDRMEARAEFIMSRFRLNNCYRSTKEKRSDSKISFSEMAKSCARFENGAACWKKLAAELLKAKEI